MIGEGCVTLTRSMKEGEAPTEIMKLEKGDYFGELEFIFNLSN